MEYLKVKYRSDKPKQLCLCAYNKDKKVKESLFLEEDFKERGSFYIHNEYLTKSATFLDCYKNISKNGDLR